MLTETDLAERLAEYRPYLKSIAEKELPKYLCARLDSSDLIQETLLRAYRQSNQFAGNSSEEFAGWLAEILRNQIVDATRFHGRQLRDVRRDEPLMDPGSCRKTPSGSELVRRREMNEGLERALAELPEKYRTVIMLRQEEDLGFEEIGRRMQRSPDAARMLWGRAILQLSTLMHRHG